jgi:hypothetical protein
MSSQQINTDTNLLSLVEMKAEETVESPDSEELLIKSSNKGKIKDSSVVDNKPPIINEKKSNSSLSYKLKSNNDLSYNITNKGKSAQNLFREPSSSVVSDIEGDPDNLSITTSAITDASDMSNMKNHQSPTQSLRNKRFSYNSPSTSNTHQWTTASSSNINIASVPSTSSTPAVPANPSTSSATNNNSNNGGHRPSLTSHGLPGSFVELINLTNNALNNANNNASSNSNNNNNNNNNNSNNNEASATPASRHGSLSSNLQQSFYRLGLSDNINIETIDPSSNESGENQRPSQVGPGEAAWMLFRIYAVIKFIWSLAFSVIYFVHFIIKSKSCDKRIYKFSIAFTAVFSIQAISTLFLIIYLPTSITRYTNVVRRRVVISNRAWKITAYTVLAEIVMVIIGTILIFDKDPECSLTNENMAYIKITKCLIILVVSFYTVLLMPFFILPCTCTFKLLPEYKGISDKVLKRFNSILYNPTEEVDEEDAPSCSICMENYKPGTRIKRLPCKHEFHPECITQWLETNNSCPICRTTFT